MKKLLLLSFLLVFLGAATNAQLKFQGTFTIGGNYTSVDVAVRPTTNFNGYLTNVVVLLQVPTAATQPVIVPTSLTSYFTAFTPLTPVSSGGFTTYGFSAVNATVTTNTALTTGSNYNVLRLAFTGGTPAPTGVRLAHLANGGPGTLYQFMLKQTKLVQEPMIIQITGKCSPQLQELQLHTHRLLLMKLLDIQLTSLRKHLYYFP